MEHDCKQAENAYMKYMGIEMTHATVVTVCYKFITSFLKKAPEQISSSSKIIDDFQRGLLTLACRFGKN
jgi:hypothetical protein